MTTDSSSETVFDGYAGDYDAALAQGLSVSGEDKSYFARGRVKWLAGCLQKMKERPQSALDFGCGTGGSVSFLLELIELQSVLGVDTSTKSLEVAKETYSPDSTQFMLFNQHRPSEQLDLAFCNGVFHHIPPAERATAISYIHRSLKTGGLFSFWENNPWNPATRYVMSRIPFDRDAITLTPPEARSLLRAGGFEILRTDFMFIFPRMLRWFRFIEPSVSRLPLGTQYQILCRKL